MPDAPRCVYCRMRPAVPEWQPFCSERCKMADLGQWLSGGYRIAGPLQDPPPPDPAEEEDPDASDE